MTRDISSTDDMIDVREVIERFEDLEALGKPWVAGCNMPGYLPDSEPSAFDTWDAARDAIVSDLEEALEQAFDCEGLNVEAIEHLAEDIRSAIERLNAATDEVEFGETIGSWHYWINRVENADCFEDKADFEEYALLQELLSDLKGYGGDEQWRGDWYPVSLIRDSHFEDYAQELAEDCGNINSNVSWPYTCIDWERAARELQQDYSSVEFDGVTYWYR